MIAALVSWPRVALGQLLFLPGFSGQASELSRTEYSVQQEVGLGINFTAWSGLQNVLRGCRDPLTGDPSQKNCTPSSLATWGIAWLCREAERSGSLLTHCCKQGCGVGYTVSHVFWFVLLDGGAEGCVQQRLGLHIMLLAWTRPQNRRRLARLLVRETNWAELHTKSSGQMEPCKWAERLSGHSSCAPG